MLCDLAWLVFDMFLCTFVCQSINCYALNIFMCGTLICIYPFAGLNMNIFVSVCLSVSVSVLLSLSVCLCLCVCLFSCGNMDMSTCVCQFLSLFQSVHLYSCIAFCLLLFCLSHTSGSLEVVHILYRTLMGM